MERNKPVDFSRKSIRTMKAITAHSNEKFGAQFDFIVSDELTDCESVVMFVADPITDDEISYFRFCISDKIENVNAVSNFINNGNIGYVTSEGYTNIINKYDYAASYNLLFSNFLAGLIRFASDHNCIISNDGLETAIQEFIIKILNFNFGILLLS